MAVASKEQTKQPSTLQPEREEDMARNQAIWLKLNDYERCHFRWCQLFDWLLKVMEKDAPKTYRKVIEAMEREGLVEKHTWSPLSRKEPLPSSSLDLYRIESPNDLMNRVEQLTKSIELSNLRGKTRRKINPVFVARTYIMIYEAIKDLPQKGYSGPKNLGRGLLSGNIAKRYEGLKDRLDNIQDSLPGDLPPDGDLSKWSRSLNNREIARKVTAHVVGAKPSSLKKIFTEAKKRSPSVLHLFKRL